MKKNKLLQYLEITIGVVCMMIAFYFFFLPMDLVIGGVTGLSIIFQEFIDVSLFILIGNTICLIIGTIFLKKDFFIKTIYGTLLMPLLTFLFELLFDQNLVLNGVANEVSKLLISVVAGGILAAIGLGLCFRNNATTGGMDVIQKIFTKYFKIPYSKAVYCTDGLVIALALYTIKLERVFYGIIAILLIGYVLDKIIIGGKTSRTVYIITKKPMEIKDAIYKQLNRGVTFTKVSGGYSGNEYTMVICTLDKNKSYHLKEIIINIDKESFTYVTETQEVIGVGFSENQ